MSQSIRKPASIPNILAHAERAVMALTRLKGPDSEATKEIVQGFRDALKAQADFNRSLFDQSGSLPPKHGETHVGDDPIPLDSAVGLGNANAEGDDRSLARSDHIHKRDVRVAYDGVDVGTRNRINFTSTGTVPADDSVNDEVDVPLANPSAVEEAMLFALFVGA